MTQTPERPEAQPAPGPPESVLEGVQEVPTAVELGAKLERATGAKATDDTFVAQVADDSGKPLIQTPQTQDAVVEIPATPAQLAAWAKGSPANALTWFARFWLRMVQKAIHFGRRVVIGGLAQGQQAQQAQTQAQSQTSQPLEETN